MSNSKKLKLPPLAFLVCLIIAALGWVVVTFSKDYRVTLDFKVQCYNLPEGKKSVTVSDTVVALTFNQKGLKYLMKPFSNKDRTVYISVSDLIKPKHKVTVYTFSSKEMRDYLVAHCYGSDLVAVESPEVITFYLR
ncbi:MAG: hypothetical protein IKQ75_01225 [Bacteroidales bacterium]|nr:hypothetical protein [Bacteroidales bacterium]MBR6160472.1 hypothetical protein [Bacteroidales bacterium]